VIKIEGINKSDANRPPEMVKVPISEKEQKLLTVLRDVNYGEVVVIVKNGSPVHIEEIKKSIKL
jgi:hypothetical protein